jgi:glycosyltransferase involved in cell wall biosynthesis
MPSIDMNLKIAGRGDVEMELHALVKRLSLQNKVTFLGFLNPDQLDHIGYQAFLGYNLLENQGKSYYYSLANKTFDYMQAGIPVLCSPFPEYLALEKEYPFIYFSELTVSEIIRSVNFLINNPTEYEIRKQAALEAKQVLNWEMEQIKLARIYNDLFG